MSPTLSDEDLRRRLFEAHALRRHRSRARSRSRATIMDRAVLTGLCILYLFFFAGLIWHLITYLPLQ